MLIAKELEERCELRLSRPARLWDSQFPLADSRAKGMQDGRGRALYGAIGEEFVWNERKARPPHQSPGPL